MRYANGTILKLDMPEDKGPRMGGIFIGEDGKIEINRNRLASNPPELIKNETTRLRSSILRAS